MSNHRFGLQQKSDWRALRACLLSAFLVSQLINVGLAQDSTDVGLPGLSIAERDEAIQSPAEFFGFKIGSRHLRHDQVTAYFNYLAAASKRTKLIEYGTTQGGRPLYSLAVSSERNIERLEEIRTARRKLSTGALRAVPSDAVLVMFMGYCVHGDEASAVNAATIVAYDLVAGNSPSALEAIDQAVLFIDPALNPDGVDRFANWVNENRGKFPAANPDDREHQAPWPGGRTSYYWFDLNRDWLPLTHPESQGRMRLFHQWKPNVVLDYHEMGPNNTYFFQPGVPARNNPLAPPENLRLTRKFAERFADVLDQAGELYFTEEVFDDFYIGKGSTYPDLNGAIGILFEQGSTAGLRLKTTRNDRHFSETIANQVRTSLASVDRMLELKDQLLEFQGKFFRDALQSGKESSTTAFVLTGSPSRIKAAQTLLKQHQIRSQINRGTIRVAGKLHDGGRALIIPAAQTQFVLLKSLMQTQQSFTENVFYDVSAWHLPSAFDLEMHRLETDLPTDWLTGIKDATKQRERRLELPAEESILGVAFSPVELDSPRWVAALLKMGAEVRVSMLPFEDSASEKTESAKLENGSSETKLFPAGTFVVLKASNKTKWPAILRKIKQLSANSDTAIRWLTSGRVKLGPDLGSNNIAILPRCNPGLIVGEGTIANDAGAIWHFLDHRMQLPSTRIQANKVATIELSAYSCLILPDGSYQDWSRSEASKLKDYVTGGGTLIAIGSGIDWLKNNQVLKSGSKSDRGGIPDLKEKKIEDGIAQIGTENNVDEGAESISRLEQGESKTTDPESVRFADAQSAAALESIAGAFFMTQVDPTHPLAFGFPDEYVPVFRSGTTVHKLPQNSFETSATYIDVIAGYVSDRNRKKLLGSTAVWASPIGQGRVIMISDQPVFRGYVRSSERFLTNAILLGPILKIPPKLK